MKLLLFSALILFSGIGIAFAEPVTAQNNSQEKIHFVDEQIMIMADITNNHPEALSPPLSMTINVSDRQS